MSEYDEFENRTQIRSGQVQLHANILKQQSIWGRAIRSCDGQSVTCQDDTVTLVFDISFGSATRYTSFELFFLFPDGERYRIDPVESSTDYNQDIDASVTVDQLAIYIIPADVFRAAVTTEGVRARMADQELKMDHSNTGKFRDFLSYSG